MDNPVSFIKGCLFPLGKLVAGGIAYAVRRGREDKIAIVRGIISLDTLFYEFGKDKLALDSEDAFWVAEKIYHYLKEMASLVANKALKARLCELVADIDRKTGAFFLAGKACSDPNNVEGIKEALNWLDENLVIPAGVLNDRLAGIYSVAAYESGVH